VQPTCAPEDGYNGIGVVRSVQGDRGCGGMGAVQQFGGAA
jgi:hypothetical protein